MTDEQMKQALDGTYGSIVAYEKEIEDFNTKFIKSLNLSFTEMRHFFSDDLVSHYIKITSKIEKCKTPKSDPKRLCEDNSFAPIHVHQQCGCLGDDYTGTVYFHHNGECYKFDYEC